MNHGKTFLTAVIFLALSLALGGCATLGPVYQKVDKIPEGMGLVYIYRPGGFIGGGVSYNVKVGETVITTLYSGGYYPYFAKPGETEFWAKTESRSAITLDIKAKETYYLKGTVGVGFFVGRPHLMLVAKEVGENEILQCKLIPEEKGEKEEKK